MNTVTRIAPVFEPENGSNKTSNDPHSPTTRSWKLPNIIALNELPEPLVKLLGTKELPITRCPNSSPLSDKSILESVLATRTVDLNFASAWGVVINAKDPWAASLTSISLVKLTRLAQVGAAPFVPKATLPIPSFP